MHRIKRIRRAAAIAAGLVLAWVGLAGAAPAAFAMIPSHGGISDTPTAAATRTVVVGGMPGWEIALIAIGAALLAAALTVLANRARAAHRQLAGSAG
jgi:NhaP-type Na+/H+ and K+/H+ antiporter